MNNYGLKNQSQKGFTLLELLLVIGVAALLLISAVFTYRSVTEGNKATTATRLLLTIQQESRNIAQLQNATYSGIVFDSRAAAGDADGGKSPLVTSGALAVGLNNPFNGPITVAPDGAEDVHLKVVFENVSQPGCIRLIQAITGQTDLVSVGTATATYTSAAQQVPVTAANASAACNNIVNQLTWILS